MILAAAVAYILIPEDLTPHATDQSESIPLTASQTLDAAGSVLQDIGGFCVRNPEACETGKVILETARQKAQQGLQKLAGDQQHSSEPSENTQPTDSAALPIEIKASDD